MTTSDSITVQDAVDWLYDIAVIQGKATSPARLRKLAAYCRQELQARGLTEAESEVAIPGGGRPKEWDVAWKHQGKCRLAISLKSILKNLAGTVPNRVDDLIGETANVQMYSPEIVVGYLMVFDIGKDTVGDKHGVTWCDLLQQRLSNLSGRRAPSWSVGTIESFAIVRVNFSSGARLLTDAATLGVLFDELVAEVKKRNPSIA